MITGLVLLVGAVMVGALIGETTGLRLGRKVGRAIALEQARRAALDVGDERAARAIGALIASGREG